MAENGASPVKHVREDSPPPHGVANGESNAHDSLTGLSGSPSKKMKINHDHVASNSIAHAQSARVKGVAPIKKEYLIDVSTLSKPAAEADDDAAEARGKTDLGPSAGRGGKKTKGGQNHGRNFGHSKDAIELCKSRALADEFDPPTCRFGDKCKFEHNLRKYLEAGKRADLATFDGLCPLFEVKGACTAGWKCRFAGSHSNEIEREDGRKELVQVRKEATDPNDRDEEDEEDSSHGVVNIVSVGTKIELRKKNYPTPKSDAYLRWLDMRTNNDNNPRRAQFKSDREGLPLDINEHDHRASYKECPLRPSEKRRIYYGPETPILAPLTTQGNLPFRRLCVSLGAQVTWSEMAMGLPLLQGEKQEWALMKAHESEMLPPSYDPKHVVKDYDNSKDIKFGAQIAANKPWLALKTTEILTALCPNLRAIDLNCGCPIDLVFRQGAGSALLDSPTRLERILRGMNTVSGEVPVTVKIRTGTKDKDPTAQKLCKKLILGTDDARRDGDPPSGVAAIALHGRSRQQRYTRSADWEYIASCANLIRGIKQDKADSTDTVRDVEERDVPASKNVDGLPYFIGNGDILSPSDYFEHLEHSQVDACMIARGALVKPWIFEEIASNQLMDKSASERLGYIERFVRNGLEYWGSDEIGVGTTRRFLLEWLSFSCRYVPLGILEHLPPRFGDRPPAFRGRSDLETLLSSANYKDWIKISEMFLGPAHSNFEFKPKHKSNSYEIEIQG